MILILYEDVELKEKLIKKSKRLNLAVIFVITSAKNVAQIFSLSLSLF